jgi:hypothetical protein
MRALPLGEVYCLAGGLAIVVFGLVCVSLHFVYKDQLAGHWDYLAQSPLLGTSGRDYVA